MSDPVFDDPASIDPGVKAAGNRGRGGAAAAASAADPEIDDVREDDPSSSDEDEYKESGLTSNQQRLLYMISLYTHPAKTKADKEAWVRAQALMVLIYEAVVAEVLDYDYAPASAIVEGRRMYFNMSQEGRSDVDYLREEGLINGLKLSSKSYQPVTCFQISKKGELAAAKTPRHDLEEVHHFVHEPGTRELLKVHWTGELYELVGPSGYTRESSVTDCEDVSYVSSPYMPACLRFGGRPTLSNAHRAHECAISAGNIRDELDEVITLNGLSIIVAEFIPCGANQIVQLNMNLGSTERVQGGFFTALVDEDSAGTDFEVAPGLTSVNVLDYSLTRHINFEADIHLPEPEGVVQIEMFGVSINSDGTIFYGLQIEAIMDRVRDNLSLDHLSRLLVDVHTDSSAIVDSIISQYQRNIMDLIFSGDAAMRDKVNLILADEITPHLTAEEYMDKDEFENELKQVIGDTRAAFDISERDTLIFGEHGLLVAGPNSRAYEPLLCSYLEHSALDLFVRNYFSRMFLLMDDMKIISQLVGVSETDPNSIVTIRGKLTGVSKEIIMLEEALGYMYESLTSRKVMPEPVEQNGRALYDRLQIGDLASQLLARVSDLRKNMQGTRHEFEILREMSNIISETKNFRLQESINASSAELVKLQSGSQTSNRTLEIIQITLLGSLAFDILDRITGTWSVMDQPWADALATGIIQGSPMLWFILNMLFWLLLAFTAVRFVYYMSYRDEGAMFIRVRLLKKIRSDKLLAYLAGKKTANEDRDIGATTDQVRVRWREDDKVGWGGAPPMIEIEFDERNAFMLYIVVSYNRRRASKGKAMTAKEVEEKVMEDFERGKVFVADDGKTDLQKLAIVDM